VTRGAHYVFGFVVVDEARATPDNRQYFAE
jgi:hypothetical protein